MQKIWNIDLGTGAANAGKVIKINAAGDGLEYNAADLVQVSSGEGGYLSKNAIATTGTLFGVNASGEGIVRTKDNLGLRLFVNNTTEGIYIENTVGCVFVGATAYANVGNNKLRIGNKSTVTASPFSTDITGQIISYSSTTGISGLLIENLASASSTNGGGVLTLASIPAIALSALDNLGTIDFVGRYSDTIVGVGARIRAEAGNAWGGSNDYPAALAFYTCNDASGTLVKRMNIGRTGNISFGNGTNGASTVGASTLFNINFNGNAAFTIGVERHTTANTAGNNGTWTLSGGATSGATDKNSGMGVITTGLSTGTGFGSLRMQRLSRAASTGTSDNTLSDALIIPSSKIANNNTSMDLFNMAVATLTGAGCEFAYTIETTNGTDVQLEQGKCTVQMVNKAGAFTGSIEKAYSKQALSSGKYTVTFAISSANPCVISVTGNSDLGTAGTSKISYNILECNAQTITQI